MATPRDMANFTAGRSMLFFLVLFLLVGGIVNYANAVPASQSSSSMKSSGGPAVSTHTASTFFARGLLPTVLQGSANGTSNKNVSYDEQLGTTFTKNYTSLRYDLKAVLQQDPDGYGPAYLLNGVSSEDYWYQAGISWHWPNTNASYNPGFGFNFEVWNSKGNSIFPTNGGGGEDNFSGTVNPGDPIILGLSISGGRVYMSAKDELTGSYALETYSAFGNTFVGLNLLPATQQGYFTGLMTEKLSVGLYSGDYQKVTYRSNGSIVSSAWMWDDEFNVNTNQSVFGNVTHGPISLTSDLQRFISNGATLASNFTEFISGNATTVPTRFSYAVSGASIKPPTLSFLSNETRHNSTLTEQVSVFHLDYWSPWNLTFPIGNNESGSERWLVHGNESGVAVAPQSFATKIYHQYLVRFSYTIRGSRSGYTAPMLSYSLFGYKSILDLSRNISRAWVDGQSTWNASTVLLGSTNSSRWFTYNPSGLIMSTENVTIPYFHQYFLMTNISDPRAGSVAPVAGWYNETSTVTLNSNSRPGWQFERWQGSGQGSFSGNRSQTVIAILGPITEDAVFFPGLNVTVNGGGSVTYSYGSNTGQIGGGTTKILYLPPRTNITLVENPDSSFSQFSGWSNNQSSSAQTIVVTAPLKVAANFTPNYSWLLIPVLVAIILGFAFFVLRMRKKRASFC